MNKYELTSSKKSAILVIYAFIGYLSASNYNQREREKMTFQEKLKYCEEHPTAFSDKTSYNYQLHWLSQTR
uniref:CSON001032 protein n=1 Tax=Culicoides sonorensis TaxID=179676 RepID=A0A336LQK5_CULSO